MADEVSDAFWAKVAPLLPPHRPHPKGGRPWVDDRRCLNGVVYVLRTGVGWERVPKDFACGMTCWRRLRLWQKAGVWQRLHELLLAELRAADALDLSRVCVDSSSLRALKGAKRRATTRPTAAGRAPSTTSPSTQKARRWRRSSRRRTATT